MLSNFKLDKGTCETGLLIISIFIISILNPEIFKVVNMTGVFKQ